MSAVAQVYFEFVGEIRDQREIASGHGVRERRQLRLRHGGVRWRKLAGTALVRLPDDRLLWAELHWDPRHNSLIRFEEGGAWSSSSRHGDRTGLIAAIPRVAVVSCIARLQCSVSRSSSVYRDGTHWYEAHGVGRVKIKIKRLLDEP